MEVLSHVCGDVGDESFCAEVGLMAYFFGSLSWVVTHWPCRHDPSRDGFPYGLGSECLGLDSHYCEGR